MIYQLHQKPTPQCHASTIAQTPSGLIAAWFGGSYEGHPDVSIWIARHNGTTWLEPFNIADCYYSCAYRKLWV